MRHWICAFVGHLCCEGLANDIQRKLGMTSAMGIGVIEQKPL